MDFRRKLQRAWKHTSRAVTKPLGRPNKSNLRELDKVLSKVLDGRITRPQQFNIQELRYGAYDFSWLTLLTEEELLEMAGAWVAAFQTTRRGDAAASTYAHRLGAPLRHQMLLTEKDSEFWKRLQQVKDDYKAIAGERASGTLSAIQNWITRKRERVANKVYHNRWVGEYLTTYQTIEAVYADATYHGATSDLDRKILAAGGVWRIVKIAAGSGRKAAELLVAPNPRTALKLAKKGVDALNIIGGLAAGLTDLVREREAHFERLSARYGLDQKIDKLKKKYLGPGVIAAGDTLQAQMLSGPGRLDRAGTITLAELDELRATFEHAIWWTKVWRMDIKELRADLEESAITKHLRHLFRHVTAEGGVVKPSQLSQVEAYIEPDSRAVQKQIEELEAKVQRFEDLMGRRLRKMDDLLAGYRTRQSISRQQKRAAALRSTIPGASSPTHLNYDLQREIAHEIANFDRSRLRHVKPGRKKPNGTGKDPRSLSLHEILTAALAERRKYVGPPVDEEEEESDGTP